MQPRVAKKPLPGKPEKPVPVFKQGRKESEKQFLYRVNQVCKSVIKEAAFEKKYGVDVKRNPETGKVNFRYFCKCVPNCLFFRLKALLKEKKMKSIL